MKRLTEKRCGKNVIPLRQNGKIKWSICSAGMGDAPTQYLYGDHADRLAAIEDILGDEYELDRLRELVEADKDERCVVVPVAIGATVYHITTCKDFRKVLDGTLYNDNGALGTATGYYCPCELAENCPFDAEDFDCDKNKNKLNIFEDTVEEIHIDECEEYFRLNYSGVINSEDIGKTVFLTREEALAALKAREQDD